MYKARTNKRTKTNKQILSPCIPLIFPHEYILHQFKRVPELFL
jgi:hypothetical protein